MNVYHRILTNKEFKELSELNAHQEALHSTIIELKIRGFDSNVIDSYKQKFIVAKNKFIQKCQKDILGFTLDDPHFLLNYSTHTLILTTELYIASDDLLIVEVI